jgi:hypothetical protein
MSLLVVRFAYFNGILKDHSPAKPSAAIDPTAKQPGKIRTRHRA